MKKPFFFQFIFFCLIIQSCQEQAGNENTIEKKKEDPKLNSEEICSDPTYELEQNQRTELEAALNTEINLPKMKKEIGFLSMGWSIHSDYLQVVPEGYRQYNYGAVGSLIKKPQINIKPGAKELKSGAFKFISIITHKPWTNETEKYYSTDNEIVIGFESKVNYEHLKELNLVGQSEADISTQFGMPDLIKDDCYAYKEDQKVLILHLDDEAVDWIKFYNLNKATFLQSDYPEELFSWTVK